MIFFKESVPGNLKKIYNTLDENMIHGQQLSKIGSWTHDIKNDEIFLSNEIHNILDCSPQDFDGELENFYKFIHPEDIEIVKNATQGALYGKAYDIEYRIITSNGVKKYIHEKTKALYNANNSPIKMIGIMQDISYRKLIENNLMEIGENLNQAQRVAGVGSWKYDVLKDELYGSDEMYQIYGIDPLKFHNFKEATALIHPEDQIKVKTAMENNLNGESCKIEFRIPQKDGTVKFVDGIGEPLFNKDGQVVGVLGTLQDITERKLLKLKLEESYKNLSAAQELAHIGSWKLDIINNKSDWSEEAYRIYGITPEQYDGTYEGFLKYVYPKDVSIIQSLLKDPPTEPFDMEYRIIRPDGSIRYVYQRVIYQFDSVGNPTNIYGTIQDITDKKEMEKSLEVKQKEISRMQKRSQVMIQNSIDVFEIISPDGTIKYMSVPAERVIGYKPEERIGKKVFDYYTGKELEKLKKMIDLILKHPAKEIQGDIVFKNKEGKELYLDIHMQNFVNDPSIEGIIINFRDITRRINIEKRMAYISTHDNLTGLPNHKYFNKNLRLQCKHAKETTTKFALMMLDVEGLKYVNYSFGYELGEKLIIEIVNRLKATLNEEILISRYSDDHFAIIVQGLETYDEYKNLAKKIVNLFLESFHVDKYNIDISINIGICIYPKDAQDSFSLMKQSRIALIRSKNEGKNSYKFYSSDLDVQNYKEFILRSDLHNAIEKNQLQVYYQPIINLKTNEIIATEALIRWEHPDWGIINPDEFIYIAEEIGFIIDIGKWILQEVCKNYLEWLKKGYPDIKVSINYSVIQFFENDYIENIINTINEFKLDPHFLIIEITESILMKKNDKAISDIEKLQSFGIQVAIDDFGTGYSSFAYLKSFNIDILKLDSSFIKDFITDFTSNVIIKSMIAMSKELKIKVVAEGIETWEQLSLLRELNCFSGQGYIYSSPVAPNKFETILSKRICKPILISFDATKHKERRKFFRIQFHQLLEAYSTIKEINGKSIDIGDTKVLIQDIGPGGLCFISNLNLPIEKNIIMKFTTHLKNEEIRVQGRLVWVEKINDVYEYGIEFTIDENDREELVRILNTVQIKMRKDILFDEGNFTTKSPSSFFYTSST